MTMGKGEKHLSTFSPFPSLSASPPQVRLFHTLFHYLYKLSSILESYLSVYQ